MILTGKCSWFGGPDDKGVGEHETLAMYPNKLARDLNCDGACYCALPIFLRPDRHEQFVEAFKDFLRDCVVAEVTTRYGRVYCRIVDVGPKDRLIDLSKKAMIVLGVETDDEVTVSLTVTYCVQAEDLDYYVNNLFLRKEDD